MDAVEMKMHFRAAEAAGQESACGVKFQHESEWDAERAARALNSRKEVEIGELHRVEPYPCVFCSPMPMAHQYYWHVGPEMTPEERETYQETTQTT